MAAVLLGFKLAADASLPKKAIMAQKYSDPDMPFFDPKTNEARTVEQSASLSWNEYFMGFAIMAAHRSKDPKYQVGACIVNTEKRIVSTGYNGFPDCHRGTADDSGNESFSGWSWAKEEKHRAVCHAEMNAILNANQPLKDCTLYVTRFPCIECAKLIVQSRIAKVYYLDSDKARIRGWPDAKNLKYTEFDASQELFQYAQQEIAKLQNKDASFKYAEFLPEWSTNGKEPKESYLGSMYKFLRRY